MKRGSGRWAPEAPNRLGLPPNITACLFDLDGVITHTAEQHARAWKETFESVLHVPFDAVRDYDEYVDGKPREEGVRSFLEARAIAPDPALVQRIAEQKDHLFLQLIEKEGVQTYPGTIQYMQQARATGHELAVVSSSRHTTEVLQAANLNGAFDAQVDGIVAEREHLQGKPAPDTYLRAAGMLHTPPIDAAVYEDALAGVQAGKAGGFGRVIGIDRAHQKEALRRHGADLVVDDLAELLDR